MVGNRRTSTRDGVSIKQKRKTKVISPESSRKRRRKNNDVFFFTSDFGDDDAPVVNGYGKGPSKQRLNGASERKKYGTQYTTNGGTPTRTMATRYSRLSRESSSSPVPSESSSDPLTSQRTPITPTKPLTKTPTKTKSSKRNNALANDFDIPTTPTPATSFGKKLAAITKGSRKNESKQESTKRPENIAISESREKPKPSGKAPKKREFESIKSYVLGKLCGRIPIPLTGKPAALADEIHNVMARAVQGESNSLLLLGGPGSAKSSLVNTALHQLKQDHPDPGSFYTIRLDGRIQTDDKIALKEIARQLALEMNVEMEKMSFADTLTTFLYTLSHPSELAETEEDTTSASVIFILDSFDEFLSHPRQALLYNLFDIAQSRKAPIAVICLGQQVNAIDGLEKRVKSRFGGRILQVSRPGTRKEFWNICEAALMVDDGSDFAAQWNKHIQELENEQAMKDVCEEIFVQSRDVREFFNRSIPVITSLEHDSVFLPPAESWSTNLLSAPESKLSLIEGLSQLELGLLISATRLETFHALETFNFNMVYEVYSSLVSRARTHISSVTALGAPSVTPGGSVQLWGRDMAARAWERLGEIGLWTYSGRGEGRGRFVRCEVGMVEVAGICERRKLLNSAMRGWFKEGI